jgi:hypothetical protein
MPLISTSLIVIISIHQPSSKTFQLFDKALLLSAGRSHYFGPIAGIEPLFESLGYPVPIQMNPAEFCLDLINIDFATDHDAARLRLDKMQTGWKSSSQNNEVTTAITGIRREPKEEALEISKLSKANYFGVVLTLVHRSWIKSYRDVVAYGVRIAMYTGKPAESPSLSVTIVTFADNYRPRYYDGHSLASSTRRPRRHPALYQRHLLLRGFHVVHVRHISLSKFSSTNNS